MNMLTKRVVAGAVVVPALAAAGVVALVVTATVALAAAGGPRPDLERVGSVCAPAVAESADGIAGLSAIQVANATVIIDVAAEHGLGRRGAVVGVMTAWTESSLVNVDHGDSAGPDSRGLFQQRDSWGPAAVRMDPAGAAGLFYDRLETVDGWRALPPWVAAQQVQRSAFPDGSNYAAHYLQATALVAAITGITPDGGSIDTASTVADAGGGFDLATWCGGQDAGVDGVTGGAWGGFSNGLIPASALCPLDAAGQLLRCDAAAGWNLMAAAYQQATGTRLCITDSYRSLAVQRDLRARKPLLAAVPGTSNHGWGLAVDLCEPGRVPMGYDTPTYRWLKAHGPAFGWVHPGWAEPGQGQQEPWHWEYTGGTQ